MRDPHLLADIRRIHADNYGVYGARKVRREFHREGREVARCTVERLMRGDGLAGMVGRNVRTTVADPGHERAAHPVTGTSRPAGLIGLGWLTLPTWPPGAPRRPTSARHWPRRRSTWRCDGATAMANSPIQTIHHSHAGSQYTSFRFTTWLAPASMNRPGFRGEFRCWLQPPVVAGIERSTSIRTRRVASRRGPGGCGWCCTSRPTRRWRARPRRGSSTAHAG